MKKYLLLICLFLNLFAYAQPTSEFTISASSGCVNNLVEFTSLATGGVVEWAWDFGDGTTSDEINPDHIFSAGGTFTITLTVSDLGGLTDDYALNYTVRSPVAAFSLSPDVSCSVPSTVFFTDESYFPDTWSWNFGDGGSSTAKNPIHSYLSPGVYHIVLSVLDTNNGCTSTFTDSVTISQLTADIGGPGSYFGCAPLPVDFVDASTNLGFGEITDWFWDFGDGSTSDLQNPSTIYDAPGVYNVSLTVTNSMGCTNTIVSTSRVQAIGPDVDFDADVTSSPCTDLTVNFTNSTTFGAPIVSWAWNFGDGGTSGLFNPTHVYTAYGTYDVSLTASDLDGCSRTFVRPDYIVIEDVILPSFDVCPSDQTESLSTDCDFELPDYTGLATVSDNCTAPLVVLQTPAPGTVISSDQVITLSTLDESGNYAECDFTVYLEDNIDPIISCPGDQLVSFDADCAYTLLDYTGLATVSDNCLTPTVVQSPIAGTIITGVEIITLTATDTAGNTASCVFDVVPSDLTAPTISCPTDMTVNNDLGACGALVTYSTPVGLDNCSATTSLTAGLASGSEFPVGVTTNTYTVSDGVGLTASCSFDITVIDAEAPIISCPSSISQNNDAGDCGALVTFADPVFSDNCPGGSFEQVGGLATGAVFPVGTTTNDYLVIDAAGNSATCTFDITIIDTENPTINCPANIASCAMTINFDDPIVADNCSVESWGLTDGFLSGSDFPVGITTTIFEVVDSHGNVSTCSFTIERFDTPSVNAGEDQTMDAGFPSQLNASSTIVGSYSWSPPDGLSDPNVQNPVANPQLTTLYTVTVTTENGCSASDDVQVNVFLNIEINNFISPNGDGKNDHWEIKGNYLLDACTIKILDSWGNAVYESQGYDDLWNGTIEGEQLQQGVYYYIIDCGDGSPLTGSITLIR